MWGMGMWKGGYKGGGGAWGGKGGGGAWGGGGGSWDRGIPGLRDALTEAFAPVASEEPGLDDLVGKIMPKIQKVADKYHKDERLGQKTAGVNGTTTAKALVEEFVENVMGSISGLCYEKEWFSKVSFTQPLLMAVLYCFSSAKIFTRTLKPQLIKHIEDGIFKWQEEERITRAMWTAIENSGINAGHQKKANQHLMKAYDDAHFKAPYGTTANESPELAVLQDFAKGWISEFVGRAWDVLENGMADTSRDVQAATIAQLFQNLMDPNIACMPYDIATEITNSLGGLPAAPWAFIDQATLEVFHALDNPPVGGKGAKRAKIA